jgi:hypothetical protein
MVPNRGKGKASKASLKDEVVAGEESLEMDMEEERSQSVLPLEQDIGPQTEVMADLSLDHLFEPTTISEIATAIELDLESHAPSPAR